MCADRQEQKETAGVVIHRLTWLYDLGCFLVGMGSGFRHKTLQLAKLKAGDSILDVGCGTGVLTRLAALSVGDSGVAIGVDPSAEMLQVAEHHAAKEKSSAQFKLGLIEALPFKDESFDVVLSSMMLHHLPPKVKLAGLQETFRVLKPGGRLLVVDFDTATGMLGRMLMFPWRKDPAVKDNLAGHVADFIQKAGFINLQQPRPKLRGLISFWLSTKPGA